MPSWFHAIKGRYHIADKWIGINYSILDPLVANMTWVHEMSHSLIALQSDFGQATNVIAKVLQDYELDHLSDEEKGKIGKLIHDSQEFVQEGFATFMQLCWLRRQVGKAATLSWANENLPPKYLERFEKLAFAFEMSERYREYFTQKIPHLVMETAIRRYGQQLKILSSPELLEDYLSNPDNNPDKRLEKIIHVLQNKSWLVTKSLPEIAEAAGITYHDLTTKKEAANYLTYVLSLTDRPKVIQPEQIGDIPEGLDGYRLAGQNIIIGNMNVSFTEKSEVIYNYDDFFFYTNVIEAVFISLHGDGLEYREVVKLVTGQEPEVSFGAFTFRSTGEKYLTITSKEHAAEILNNQFKDKTVIVKWGGYDVSKNQFIWSEVARPPDIVLYNNARQLTETLKAFKGKDPEVKLKRLHVAVAENHPVQTLLLKVEGQQPIHAVNTFGNRDISEILKEITDCSELMTNEELRADKKHLNNLLAFLDFPWEVDWIETILNGNKNLYLRDGRIYSS